MPDTDEMLDAHVLFELSRWRGGELSASVDEEVTALFTWLAGVRLEDLVDEAAAQEAAVEVLCRGELGADLEDSVVNAVVTAQLAAGQRTVPLADLVPREAYDRVAGALSGLTEARAEVILQVTTSEVYAQLMSHVLYQGIKNYVQSENLIAKKVPGAAAFMRMGQSAVNAAAPKLEASVDRQLTAFVNANISDTIRDSRVFLTRALDETVLAAVADELWQTNAETTVADALALVPAEALAEVVRAVWASLVAVRDTPLAQAVLADAVADFFAAQGQWSVADLLADVGLTLDAVRQLAGTLVVPAIAMAVDDGYVEERIRARLAPFYAQYVPACDA